MDSDFSKGDRRESEDSETAGCTPGSLCGCAKVEQCMVLEVALPTALCLRPCRASCNSRRPPLSHLSRNVCSGDSGHIPLPGTWTDNE